MFAIALNHQRPLTTFSLLALLFFSGCATVQNNHDPIEGVNRSTEAFNNTLDKIVLKPLAEGYMSGSDPKMRKAISNFYDNLTYPNTILNGFLQGKVQQGVEDLFRFVINSSVGLVGLIDVASHVGLEKHKEDFGQTLAVWGVSQGAYIVYPIYGSNSVRNTPDFITATATDGLFWAALVLAPPVTIPLTVLKYVEKRARLLDASNLRDELALDPYLFTREAWRQNREYLIYDGNPPAKPSDDEENDDWSDDSDNWEDDDNWEDEAPKQKAIDLPPVSETSAPKKEFNSRVRVADH